MPFTPTPSHAPYPQQVMEVQRHLVGRIIGRGGETVSQIQQKSGTNVKIDQNVPEVRSKPSAHSCGHTCGGRDEIACLPPPTNRGLIVEPHPHLHSTGRAGARDGDGRRVRAPRGGRLRRPDHPGHHRQRAPGEQEEKAGGANGATGCGQADARLLLSHVFHIHHF